MGTPPNARFSSPRVKSHAWPGSPPPPHTGLPLTPSHQSEFGVRGVGEGGVGGRGCKGWIWGPNNPPQHSPIDGAPPVKVDAEPRPRRYSFNRGGGVGGFWGGGGSMEGRVPLWPPHPPSLQDIPTPRAGRGVGVAAQSTIPNDAAVQEVNAGLGEGGGRGVRGGQALG